MNKRHQLLRTLKMGYASALSLGLASAPAFAADDLEDRLAALAAQNEALLKLAQEQQAQIGELKARLDAQQAQVDRQAASLQELNDLPPPLTAAPPARTNDRFIVSGEAGLAFFAGGSNAEFPNEEFRVDDARLFVEAQVARNAYLVSTLELFRRESYNDSVQVGPLFLDVENVFGSEYGRLFNLRVGRFDTPFGYEYQERYVMENPLISHTVADLWGIDEGVGLYGDHEGFTYAAAIQNGGTSILKDFDSDKSVAIRVGYDLTPQFHLSGSLMRTGDLDAAKDARSEMWIGNVVFVPIGSAQTTKFWADLAQIDFSYRWDGGKLSGAFGGAWYDDNDPLGDNSRDFEFYHLEARQNLLENLYAAIRYSALEVDGGYPISGNGARSIYLFGGVFTERLERLSLGFGWWALDDLVFKVEYSLEDGSQTNGQERSGTDQLAAEVGVRF